MGEFGHAFLRGKRLCIDSWGSGPFVICIGEKAWRFEDSEQFGPALIKRNGELCSNPYPADRSPFWRAHFLWARQGRKTGLDGVSCMWAEPKPTLIRIVGRMITTVEKGEPDGLTVNADTGVVCDFGM